MPSSNINLVPQDIQQNKQKYDRFRIVQITSIIQLVIVLAVTVGVLFFSFTLSNSIDSTKNEIDRQKTLIASQVNTISLIARVEAKASVLEEVFVDRIAYSRVFSIVPSILPVGTTIETLSVSGNSLSITGNAVGTIDVAKFLIVAVEEGKGGELFEAAELSAVGVDQSTGETTFTARLLLKEGVLK